MRFGDFEIKINLPGRKNLWAKILIGLTLGFLISGIKKTHWLVSYREGYSVMVPREKQLSRVGPVFMTVHHVRSGPEVLFYSRSGEILFREKQFSIPMDNMLAIVHKFSGRRAAFLWIYNDNPSREVWEIDVNNERV